MTKDLFDTDWNQELEPEDKATRHENGDELEVVLLAGLQRLAREAGIIKQACVVQTPAPTMVQAIFSSTFDTERGSVTFVGTADCTAKNTQGKYAQYPTAVAESRAEARSLRKALGIRMLSSEEIGFREGVGALESDPSGKASSQQVAAIETLCESRGIDVVTALAKVLPDDRANVIFELTELTLSEAQSMMSWLNEQKPSAKAARDARKAELKSKKGDK